MDASYLSQVMEVLRKIAATEGEKIALARDWIYASLAKGEVWHLFGSGHSSLIVQEAFHRAGGLVPVNPLLEPFLTPVISPAKSGRLERIAEIAEILLDYYDLRSEEVLLVASNSGINPLAVEVAIRSQEKGLKVIAITSLSHSALVPSRHKSGLKLYQVADLVIDNAGQPGDAILSFPGLPEKVGPTSTLAGIFIINWLASAVVEKYLAAGQVPPVYLSANLPGGDKHNRQLEERYRARIKIL